MTRKLWLFPLALVLLGTACVPPALPNVPIQTGQHWFVSTVDGFLDAGRSASLSLDANGLPFLTYLSLNQVLPKGQIAPARPLSLPLIPAIMTADLTKDGVWDHGDVISTSDVTKPLPLKATDQVASTLDSKGNWDVAFTESGKLQYSTAPSGGTFGTAEDIAPVSKPVGLSITTDPSGAAWVSWLDGKQVMAATKSGKAWKVQKVAALAGPAQDPQRTSIQNEGAATLIAYSDPSGQGPMVAKEQKGGWSTEAVDPNGGGGYGISLDLLQGTGWVAYYTKDGEVREAVAGGGPWKVTSVAKTGTAPDPAGWSASIAVTDKKTQYVAYYDASKNETVLATATTGAFKPLGTTDTQDGERPIAAVTPDGSHVFVAYYDKVNLDLLLGDYVVSGQPEFVLAPVPPTATPGATTPPPAACSPKGTTVDVVAQGIKFDTNCLAAPSGQPFTINFDNKDAGTPHNVEVYSTQGGSRLFGATGPTDVITGPGTTTYKVSPQKPGSYFFQCDVHPTVMFGTFVVK